MEICGFDNHFITTGEVRSTVRRFAYMLEEIWPSLLVSVGQTGEPSMNWGQAAVRSSTMERLRGEVYFARDDKMTEHFDEYSYTPQSDGSGVLALLYAPHDAREILLRVPARKDSTPMRPSYDALLVLPDSASAVQLITPDDPASSPFSAQAREMFIVAAHGETGLS